MNNKVIVAIFALVFISCCCGFMLQVEPKSKECFTEFFSAGSEVKLAYQVTRGGLLDIQFSVTTLSPDGMENVIWDQLYIEDDESDGLFRTVATKDSLYGFCFDNSMAKFTAKVVKFHFLKKMGDSNPEELVDPLEEYAKKIHDELEVLITHQEYLRNRELRHSWTQRSTNVRVFWLSVLEAIVLVSISLLQVKYIKQFFNSKTRIPI